MTNLTSEQYRDILHNVEGCTVETPSVQHLLRRAVATFYNSFGCYPEAAGASPGSGAVFGEQTQFDQGLIFALATPMATVVVGRKVPGYRVTVVTTADVGKPHKVCFGLSECPLVPGEPLWVNYIKGVMAIYCCRRAVTAFEAAVETSLPLGVGLNSAAALEIATFTLLEVLFGKKVHPIDKSIACQYAEEDFFKKKVGIAGRICASTAKDRHAVLIDSMRSDVEWVPFRDKRVVLVGIDFHFRDSILGDEYVERTKCLRKACDILGVENLRDLQIEDVDLLEQRISLEDEIQEDDQSEKERLIDDEWSREKLDIVLKRARFYVTEMKRIEEATEAWKEGDVETFGQKMVESHFSLREDFGFDNPLLDFFVDTSLQAEGVLGSKMIGLGLNSGGCVLTLIYRENLVQYCEYVKTKFIEQREQLAQIVNENLDRFLAEQSREGAEEKVEVEESTAAQVQMSQNIQDNNEGIVEESTAAQVQMSQNIQDNEGIVEESEVVLNSQIIDEEVVIVKKKKKKCDPSKKRKKRMERDERLFLEEEELERRKTEQKEEEGGAEESKTKEKEEEGTGDLWDMTEMSDLAKALEETKANETGEEKEQKITIEMPSFYIINPVAGARMMFPLKTDLLRSRFARRIPQAKELVRNAIIELHNNFQRTPEAVGLAPATTTLFGEFLEYNRGFIIAMALPLLTVTLGCHNSTATYHLMTTSKEVGEQTKFRSPVPCAGTLGVQTKSWIDYAVRTVSEFKGHVPGFIGVIESSIPCEIGIHSCSAFQGSIYEFLEGLTGICTTDPLEKAERCEKASTHFVKDTDPFSSKCSSIRFLPTFLSREGYVLLINCQNLRMANYYLDHPAYTFLLACCKERSSAVTPTDLAERIRMCQEAAEMIGRDNIINGDERHIRCLRKRGAPEDMVKRAQYIITEQQRCVRAIEAIERDDYENLGVLMTQSHCSLRDDFEISTREIELIVNLALSVDGVLGAKLVGKGLTSTVLILAKLTSVDNCIRHVRKNYTPRRDRPFFYAFKPSSGACIMDLEDCMSIP